MDTIAAISTATGNGGIGIIRMSGKECFNILKNIFVPSYETNIDEIPGYTIKYGKIIDTVTKEVIDEVLVSFFRAPKSYTTENMCEINSHGGMIVERKILEQCLKNGAQLANPGEFTKRAFLNGRIDLSQAEGIIDLINAKTEKEAKASIKQLDGKLSKYVLEIKKDLLSIMADIEASIDYPEYDIEEVTNEKSKNELLKIKQKLIELEKSFESGKLLKEGIQTVIIGRPNAGKSSLLNAILEEDRAIVSNIEGTTRDTIEEFITIQGIPLKLVDTAGIRHTEDEIEKIGVEKALKLSEKADFVIAILDSSKPFNEEDFKILEIIKDKKAVVLLNKIDIAKKENINEEYLKNIEKTIIALSTKTKEGIDRLYQEIIKLFQMQELETDDSQIIMNVRHKNQVSKSLESIQKAIGVVEGNLPIDIISVYIKQALENLLEITGDNVSEDIIQEIFSKFCLGK